MGKPYSIILDEADRDPLESLAFSLGLTWGDRGNVKALLKAIAQGKLAVGEYSAFSPTQRSALGRAVIAAIHRGEWQDALLLADAFEAFPAEDDGLSGYIAASIASLRQPWVSRLFELIEQQQPFSLSYQDAAGQIYSFSVCGAKLLPHERRTYLDCWCEETEGNQDVPALHHNWCLRLDRIKEASIIPIQQEWHSLDAVEIEMLFAKGLAHAYEPRSEDISSEWIASDPPTRKITRSITSSFWFIREILPYGKDCVVIAPPEICDRIREQLQATLEGYS
ncbi:MAG: WYL domain-containing protein [Acaryochloris sp. RU_4_1]|nr:WYL domain-containing protein [Acaryochloris sp. RU_4_1]NJR55414.1 WYL domain-containing protein [Acaryochloris sp. CRU_2_0]